MVNSHENTNIIDINDLEIDREWLLRDTNPIRLREPNLFVANAKQFWDRQKLNRRVVAEG